MTPQRKIALVSVAAALVLIGIKLAAGIATGSLGLLSDAAHSGTDLVAALLTLFAVGVAVRPADRGHPYGHGKAEHLSALAEATILVGISLVIVAFAVSRLAGPTANQVEVTWYALAVIGVVIVIDASRSVVLARATRRYRSAAFASSALHFGADLAGSMAVLIGLLVTSAGHPEADSAAAIFVAVFVIAAAARLVRQNIDVLMDRAPGRADEAARAAIEHLEPMLELRRLRIRRAAGRHFADVVIGVPPGEGVEQAHAAASAVEEAVENAVPDTDVVVHVEPLAEVHNLKLLDVRGRVELSLHLKLPGTVSLVEAHAVATRVESAILEQVPEIDAVDTHLEPRAELAEGRPLPPDEIQTKTESLRQIVREEGRGEPFALRLLQTEVGLIVFLTLKMEPSCPLSAAHTRASAIEARLRTEHPEIADVIVHTEPVEPDRRSP